MRQIRRLPRAIQDLDEIWFTIFADNPHAADVVVQRIADATARLVDFPESGSPKFELLPDLRSIPVGSHIVYYRLSGQNIDIVRVIHAAREVKRLTFD